MITTTTMRAALCALAVFALATGAAVGGTAAASAETPTSAATATPSATSSATPSATPTTTPAPTDGPSVTPDLGTVDPKATDDAAKAVPNAEDPSLATMNAVGDHAMGSTVEAREPTANTVSYRTNASVELASSSASSSSIQGMDVSAWQHNVDWAAAYKTGARFAYVKATEGTTYQNSFYSQQYNGAKTAGLYRGAYHFATPNKSSGATQAAYFVAHGGGWTNDGKTLPPLLDIEYDPYSTNSCYGLSQSAMVSWIHDFVNTVQAKTGRAPAIYSTTNWWSMCTGNSASFGANPLMIAHYGPALTAGPGTLGASWRDWTIWQYSSTGRFVGDSNVFNGSATALAGLASPAALSSPRGSVDSAAAAPGGIALRGWALDPDTSGSIAIHVYVDGVAYARTANALRPDVALQYPKLGNYHGFSTTVPATAGSHKVCVYGINTGVGANALIGACKTVSAIGTSPRGSFDALTSTTSSLRVSGWALDGDTTASTLVAIYVDGKGVTAKASVARTDVGRAYPAWGSAHGYGVTLAAKQGTHKVCVYALNVGAGAGNPLLGCKTVVVNKTPIGHLDSMTTAKGSVSVSGWAFDPDSASVSSKVAFYIDNSGVQKAANLRRADIGKVYPSAGANHGFSMTLAAKSGRHTVCVYAIDTSGGSNPQLGCRVVTVP